MPKCAGCNTYLLTKEIYCKACKKKIADGLLTPVEDAPASEEEKKTSAMLRKGRNGKYPDMLKLYRHRCTAFVTH